MRIEYPAALPISARVAEIRDLIAAHPVIVLAGETGSGKTTQLPKICLELGRGTADPRGRPRRIGHTQPRRIAARAAAARLAQETATDLGAEVGYAVRFGDTVSRRTRVKVMTDGILLAEIGRDPDLLQYDTLIIDEAHERSLTIDFLLGYLARLLPRRPDLKIIITSATIDVDKFAAHFGGAPVVEVSGRMYPVEVRYRPFGAGFDPRGDERDQVAAIRDAVDEVCAEGPGDVLVFLSGEREISDAAEALRSHRPPGPGPVEVVPLYARLSTADQQRIFAAHQGRRIVLSTNIAETSLTVPGIGYVVDAGTARISRFSPRTKVQALPIEPISQASAQQRAGRCGRVSDGICVRLYTEEDFQGRPPYTDPEILRTNLAAVLLRMADLGLGDVGDFPFPDPPDRRHVRSGHQVLVELGALIATQGGDHRITAVGRRLSRLPVDPRIARMIVAADAEGSLAEVLPIAAALSIPDVRERPADRLAAARQAHARFADPTSDFLGLLALWRYIDDQRGALSGSAFRRMCRQEFLHYLRIREWQDLHGQLRRAASEIGLRVNDAPAEPDAVHRAILAGLLSHVGLWDERQRSYSAAGGSRFVLSPGSSLARKPPPWVMAAEIVTTTRSFAHIAAAIDPDWLEDIAEHLVVRQFSEPRWSRPRASAVASERVLLFGLPVVVDRTVPLSGHDPALARDLFNRHALVEGDWDARHAFLRRNAAAVAEVLAQEERARRRGLLADEEDRAAFFDALIPADVVSGRHFDSWWTRESRAHPRLLDYPAPLLRRTADDEAAARPAEPDRALYPVSWIVGDTPLALSYRFEPGTADDGITVDIPLSQLPALDPLPFQWGVPGMRVELVTALLRGLPKPVRRKLVPVPDTAAAAAALLVGPDAGGTTPLPEALAAALRDVTSVPVAAADLAASPVPDHLRPRYRVLDDRAPREAPSRGQQRRRGGPPVLATGRDLRDLQQRCAPLWRAAAAQAAPQWERTDVRAWDFGDLPDVVEVPAGGPGGVLRAYPALVEDGARVHLRGLPDPASAASAHPAGTARLLRLSLPDPLPALRRGLDTADRLTVAAGPYPAADALLEDAVLAVLDEAVAAGPPRSAAQFGRVLDGVRPQLHARALGIVRAAAQALRMDHAVAEAVAGLTAPALAPVADDIAAQRAALVGAGFIRRHGADRIRHLERYLRAARHRVDVLPGHVGRDALAMEQVQALEADLAAAGYPGRRPDLFWLVQELRVSLFAQHLGTAVPVSVQRIRRAAGTTGV